MAVITKEEFSNWIEFSKLSDPGAEYIDVIKLACDHFSVDYECVRPLISNQIKLKLEADMIEKNALKVKKDNQIAQFIS